MVYAKNIIDPKLTLKIVEVQKATESSGATPKPVLVLITNPNERIIIPKK